jgi:hypothetical protein
LPWAFLDLERFLDLGQALLHHRRVGGLDGRDGRSRSS